MEVKALVLTLPHLDKFFVLKTKMASSRKPIEWESSYRAHVFAMQDMVKKIAKGKFPYPLTREQEEALFVDHMTPNEAEESVTCVWVDADTTRKSAKILDREHDNVTIGGLAGYEVPGGMARYTLVVNGVGATLTGDMVEELGNKFRAEQWRAFTKEGVEIPLNEYTPDCQILTSSGDEVDFDDINFRRDIKFYNQAKRFGPKGLTEGKEFRFLTIPYEARVSIVSSRGREVLREIPRQWT